MLRARGKCAIYGRWAAACSRAVSRAITRGASRIGRVLPTLSDVLPFPVRDLGEELLEPNEAPTAGKHNDEMLAQVRGCDADRSARLREADALG